MIHIIIFRCTGKVIVAISQSIMGLDAMGYKLVKKDSFPLMVQRSLQLL